MLHRSTCAVTLAFGALIAVAAGAETRLLRHPDLHGDRVAFTYAGDLWIAPSAGGVARRLTTHPGIELFAKFSPDGTSIAFTGQIDGDEQVYVVPSAGGVPRQLTFYPAAGPLPARWGVDNQVNGWTPDGQAVLFRSMRDGWDLSDTRLFTVPVRGGLPTALPMPESGNGELSPDGARVVYSPVTRDFRHWKRYQGGWAQDLYLFDLTGHQATRITDHPRSDRDPMWIGDTIYFSSDRDGTLNLYAYDIAAGTTAQHTHSTLWDVRWPSADASTGRIVYELDGGLEIYHPQRGEREAIAIEVPTDALALRPARISASDAISGFALSPKGQRAVFAARGDVFSVPIEHGPIRNLTRSSGAHDREPAWSPDGSRIAYVSDADGEEEIWTVDPLGETATQLTDGSIGRYAALAWSPNGHRLAYRNQQQRLFVLDVNSGEVVEVADDPAPFGLEYEWSPRGGHLALSLAEPSGLRSIWIWTRADGTLRRITDPLFDQRAPTWDADGNYLYYLSDRELRPQLGNREFNYVVNRQTQVYALALRRDVPHPFPPRSDEVTIGTDGDAKDGDAKDGEKSDGDDGDDDAEEQAPIAIDFDGLAARVAQVPLEADNYYALAALDGKLLYAVGPAGYYGRSPERQVSLHVFSRQERESTELLSSVQGLALSHDREHLLADLGGNNFQRLAPAPGQGQPVSIQGLAVDRVPAEEWAQIFDEVWRRFRDYFYVENMHGYDWPALAERYRPWLAHVAHRSDLNYVISEMIGELSVGHAYIAGGDYVVPERPQPALLGARFALDEASGRYRFAEIFAGANEESIYRSPLTEIGVDVAPGDYLLAVDGRPLRAPTNPFAVLRHAGGEVVELLVGKTPSAADARRLLVAPIDDEDSLLYLAWTERNRQRVAALSGGRLGYLHIPDMGTAGLREFIKWFYGQIRSEGLVIDVRSNGGGNVSAMILERLARELLMMDFERNEELPDTYPGTVFHGHLVCLLDEDTASDGDQFAWAFRRAGLGPLVGKRSWGGVVGIYGREPLIDGGSVSVPEAGSADATGWVIEGHGVDPDIVVEQDPMAVIAGGDPQLERAVAVLLEQVEREPKTLPVRPPAPVKTE